MDCTSKQIGDACEMLVAAEIALIGGISAVKMPDTWRCFDVMAFPVDRAPQRISVKARTFKRGGDTFVSFDTADEFDWLAVILLPGEGQHRRIIIVPKCVADERARRYDPASKVPGLREWRQDEVSQSLREFEDNFCLSPTGKPLI